MASWMSKTDAGIGRVRNALDIGAQAPILGVIPAALKILLGAIMTTLGALLVIFSCAPTICSSEARPFCKFSLKQAGKGFWFIVCAAFQTIPGVGLALMQCGCRGKLGDPTSSSDAPIAPLPPAAYLSPQRGTAQTGLSPTLPAHPSINPHLTTDTYRSNYASPTSSGRGAAPHSPTLPAQSPTVETHRTPANSGRGGAPQTLHPPTQPPLANTPRATVQTAPAPSLPGQPPIADAPRANIQTTRAPSTQGAAPQIELNLPQRGRGVFSSDGNHSMTPTPEVQNRTLPASDALDGQPVEDPDPIGALPERGRAVFSSDGNHSKTRTPEVQNRTLPASDAPDDEPVEDPDNAFVDVDVQAIQPARDPDNPFLDVDF